MDVKLPDGSLIKSVPDGTTQEELLGRLMLAKHPAAQMLLEQMAGQKTVGEMSGAERFAAGYGKAVPDINRGMRQIAPGAPTTPAAFARMQPGEIPAIRKSMEKTQAEIDEAKRIDAPLLHTGAGLGGNLAGNIAAYTPLAVVPGANTYGGAALVGAASQGAAPVATGESRALNAGLGAAAGVAGQAIGRGIGRLVSPVQSRLSPEEARLAQVAADEGINLTPGQATGSRPMQVAESVMESLPGSSKAQLALRQGQKTAFNKAVLARAGITGEAATPDILAGRKAALGETFENIAGKNLLNFNAPTKGAASVTDKLIGIAAKAADELPPQEAARVSKTVENLLSQVGQDGNMLGSQYQGWRTPLRRLASAGNETGHYFGQLKSALDTAFGEQISGADAAAWQAASRQYANLKTITQAMGGAGAEALRGNVSPAQLGQSLASQVGREGRALGRGDLNDLQRAGRLFVSEALPDSFTAQRNFYTRLLTGSLPGAIPGAGIGYYEGGPEGALYGAAAGAAGSFAIPKLTQALVNSPGGRAYLTNQALSPAAREALIRALQTGAIASMPALTSQ